MNKEKFTEKSVRLVANAVRLASGLGHTYVGSEHILLALSDDDTVEAANILVENGVAYDDLRQEIVIVVGEGAPTSLNQRYLTPESRRILDDACRIAAGSKKKQAAPEHILAAIIRDTSCFAFSLIKKVGGSLTGLCAALEIIDSDELRAELYASVKPRASNLPHLFKYGRNLTDIVSLKKNDPLIGRSKEVERVLQVLSRRNKNNPCLIGEAGVGKTAIVEGVAELFARSAEKQIYICS